MIGTIPVGGERAAEVRMREQRDGRTHAHFHQRIVERLVVCANGSETPRLLLNSATDAFPSGLANSSGCGGQVPDVQPGAVAPRRCSSIR
jgi:choline dehydrogenase-like flavoprotein